jgi:hypothetical protein
MLLIINPRSAVLYRSVELIQLYNKGLAQPESPPK